MAISTVPIQWIDKATSDSLSAMKTAVDAADFAGLPPALGTVQKGLSSLSLVTVANKFSEHFSSGAQIIAVVVVNRTKATLTANAIANHGDLEFASDKSLTAPPVEMGDGWSSVGVWLAIKGFSKNPTITVKIDKSSATGNQPVYVCADITRPFLGSLHYSVSVRNDGDHGDFDAYADKFISDDHDYGKGYSESGHASVVALEGDAYDMLGVAPPHEQTQMGPGVRIYQPWMVAVAIIE